MSFEVVTEVGFAHWASYLINGDASGLEDEDQRQADAWLEYVGLGDPVDVRELGFTWNVWQGLSGEAAEYTFLSRLED
jgi:hypothetical protein